MAALLAHTQQMSRLVEDLHTISLAEVGALRLEAVPTDVRELAHEVVAAYAPAAQLQGVSLTAEAPAKPAVASIDAAATRRVLTNLVANSLRYTPAGGSITLIVRAAMDGATEIVVSDTGSGMTPELAAHAFDRFEKGPDSDGSGLGLAIARDLVEAQRGSITLDTQPGNGATVTISYPTDPD
jgi:two-component system sensor histidine kinase BaeS